MTVDIAEVVGAVEDPVGVASEGQRSVEEEDPYAAV